MEALANVNGVCALREDELMEVNGGVGPVIILGVKVTVSLVAKIVTAAATAYGACYALGKAYSHATNSK